MFFMVQLVKKHLKFDFPLCGRVHEKTSHSAKVAELVDALDLGSSSGNRMGVQVSPFAPSLNIFHS
jgi:hypothetical protein